ncbi:MAG: PKD domain-containing protein [Saprospiraceae bacterium]|nr:PKD domain-containing protein [Saprospiraceae bacterium]
MIGKSFIAALLFSFATFAQLFAQCDCVTTGNCPVPITDNGIFNGQLDVVVNGPNDLAISPLQQVCVTLTHTWIGDLSVSLTSPSGVEYLIMADVGNNYGECGTQQDNAEICIVLGNNKPLTNNTDYICNSAPCSVGTCCLNGNWTVPCGGVTSPITGVPQAPNCDLNDFNVPGDPANGTWTISVLDVCNMDVGTLHNFSLAFAGGQACYACEADGGMLDSVNLIGCVGDATLDFNLPPNYGASGPLFGNDQAIYDYTYAIVQGGIVVSLSDDLNMTSQPPGNYAIYGISYLTIHAGQIPSIIGMNIGDVATLVGSSTAPFCADLSDNFVNLTILPTIPTTVLNESVCEGDCITVGTNQVCTAGTFNFVLDSWRGCDSTVQVNLIVTQPDTVDFVANVCTGGFATVGGQQYPAPNPQYIQLQNAQGCDSIVHLTFNVLSPTAAITPALPSAITCTTASVALSAATSGSGTLTYAWSGPSSFSSASANITATTPGTYTVTVSDNAVTPACTSTASVTVPNGIIQPDLSYTGTAEICAGGSINLTTLNVQDLNNTGATLTYHSATPATPANQLASTVVSPSANTTYYVRASIGSCSDQIAIPVTVKPVPTANFTVTTPICVTNSATITYTGSAGAGATYNWNFGGGTATPGTGAGPHTVTFPSAGTQAISLTVTENGCPSTVFTQNIQVDAPLAQPVITCASTTNSVTFSWADVPNSTGYIVTSSVPGTQNPLNTYTVTGLTPGQQVSITVVAQGSNSCGNSSATQTCTAQSCPTLSVAITPVAKVCRNASTTPFNLQATATGGAGNGTYTYSGTGIVNASLGTFNPAQASLGANNITVVYNENGCTATSSIFIDVFQTPLASLTAESPVCVNDEATVTFTGPTSVGLNYSWTFDGGTASLGYGAGPQQVAWTTPGTKTVTVVVDDGNGCPSQPATATVVVEQPIAQPVVVCSSTPTSVTFSWTAVAGASGYDVDVTTGQTASQNTPTSYTVDGLLPGETVTLSVTALNSNICGNRTAISTCVAQDCPPVTINIDPVADICLDASTLPVQLVANVAGGTPSGTIEFVGAGVSASGLLNPSQANLGANIITVIYTDGPCNYTEDISINVYATPTGGFTAPSSVCVGSPATVVFDGAAQPGLTYNWDFGGGTASPGGNSPGPHSVTWATGGNKFVMLTVETPEGCISPIYTSMVQVATPPSAPQISCSNTTTSIEFTWPSEPGVGYSVTTSTGQTAVQTAPMAWQVTGLQPLEQVCITVTATNGGACSGVPVQLCCNALPCPAISVDVTPINDYCLGTSTPVQLQATVTGSNGSGTGTWSGPGILNSSTGTFSASAAGFGQHTLTYTFVEDDCTYSDAITVGVYQQPTANFTLDDAICLSNAATVGYTGLAGPNASFTWNFDGGVASPGTGAGPHQVNWSSPGLKTVSLTVTDGSCTSTIFTQQIQVDDQLAEPVIDCSAPTDGVVFTWAPVPGATGYTVVGNGAQQLSPTSYEFTGLNPEQTVSLQVTVEGNSSCPLPVVDAVCSALPCPEFTVSVEPVTDMCLTAATATVQLSATVDGAGQTGSGTWLGTGVVDAVQGVFDPAVAGVGEHQITYRYQQVNCVYEAKTIVNIVAPPTADAGPDRLLTCWESDLVVELGGSGTTLTSGVSYLWTAASGDFPGNATASRPEVSASGVFTLTVTNMALGCSDSDEVQVLSTQSSPEPSVSIEPINCGYEGKDAHVVVGTVTGGMDPYLYSLNAAPFVASNTFGYLEAGEYTIVVMDAEGCTGDTSFVIEKAAKVDVDLTANIVGQALVEFGESLSLTAISSLPASELDSIQWTNGNVLSCTDCLDPVATPLTRTTFKVTLFKGGCVVSDSLTVFVENTEAGVYVPSAFSPNDDGVNDQFMVYAGPTVTRIKSFLVFDRWGEMVHEYKDFDPKDPARGWDGKLDGKPLNPATFVWFAEVEFMDGSTRVLEGDVSLIR